MLIAATVLLASRLVTPPVTPAPVPIALGGRGSNVIYVDDDDIGDPGPNNPFISNPLEDGSPYYPFDTVQEGLDRCMPGDTVQIDPGLYTESLIVRNDGCKLLGRDRAATVLRAASPELITRRWYQLGTADLSIEQMTLRNGMISMSQDSFTEGSLRLADVTVENTKLIVTGLNGMMRMDLLRVAMQGGMLSAGPCSDGQSGVFATQVLAPETMVEIPGGCTSSSAVIDMNDSVVLGVKALAPPEGVVTVNLNRVIVGLVGVSLDSADGTGVRSRIIDSEVAGTGIRIRIAGHPFGLGSLSDVQVSRTRFAAGGINFAMYTQAKGFSGFGPGEHDLDVEACHFQGEGVHIEVNGGVEDLGAVVQMRVVNNMFAAPGAGLDATFNAPDFPPARTGRVEAGFDIINNTFAGNDTGIRLTTTPHTLGLHSFSSLIKNNIIAGGRTGIEVHGLDDHIVTVENNDVLGRADRRYVGDLPDQTGRNGNISLPPWFVGANDFRLQKISPCIDRGGSGPEVPLTDIDGLARPQDGNGDSVIAPDMGAHERPGPPDRRSVTLRKL